MIQRPPVITSLPKTPEQLKILLTKLGEPLTSWNINSLANVISYHNGGALVLKSNSYYYTKRIPVNIPGTVTAASILQQQIYKRG